MENAIDIAPAAKPDKICSRCKHCNIVPLPTHTDRYQQYNCFHPNNIYGYSPVDGAPQFRLAYCVDMRKDTMCSLAGNWYEEGSFLTVAKAPDQPTKTATVKIKIGSNLLQELGM